VLYTLSYIVVSPFEKLFSFNLKEEAAAELSAVVEDFRGRYVERQFNSLEILKGL
jgi:DNA repair protein RecO (recombination protein O)